MIVLFYLLVGFAVGHTIFKVYQGVVRDRLPVGDILDLYIGKTFFNSSDPGKFSSDKTVAHKLG